MTVFLEDKNKTTFSKKLQPMVFNLVTSGCTFLNSNYEKKTIGSYFFITVCRFWMQ